MEFDCSACGAHLRVNPILVGAKMSCPQCGTRVDVPREAPAEAAGPEPAPAKKAKPKAKPKREVRRGAFTLWLLAAQLLLFALGASCIYGAFSGADDQLPEWSYLRENELLLAGSGVAVLMASAAAGYRPILWTLACVLVMLGLCGLHFYNHNVVDASRVLALSGTMLALWCALQHRRAITR